MITPGFWLGGRDSGSAVGQNLAVRPRLRLLEPSTHSTIKTVQCLLFYHLVWGLQPQISKIKKEILACMNPTLISPATLLGTHTRCSAGLRFGDCGGHIVTSLTSRTIVRWYELCDMLHYLLEVAIMWSWRDGHGQQQYSGRLQHLKEAQLVLRGPKCAKNWSPIPLHHQLESLFSRINRNRNSLLVSLVKQWLGFELVENLDIEMELELIRVPPSRRLTGIREQQAIIIARDRRLVVWGKSAHYQGSNPETEKEKFHSRLPLHSISVYSWFSSLTMSLK